MEIFLAWIVGAFLAAWVAAQRGRSVGGVFLVSLVLSPVIGIIAAFAMRQVDPNAPTAKTHTRCPECQEWIQRTARKCKHCGAIVADIPEGMIPCPWCRAANAPDAKFCTACTGNLRA